MKRAYYSAPVAEFLTTDERSVFGELATHYPFELQGPQKEAWNFQIRHLKSALGGMADGHIFFEFQIPRIGKRADVVLLLRGIVFVLEYKVGESKFDRAAIAQAMDYALDLKNFHSGSHNAPIVPVLIATEGALSESQAEHERDRVYGTILATAHNLTEVIKSSAAKISAPPLDAMAWASASYRPTPTIVEAAQALYNKHSVSEISRSDAAAKNLAETATEVERIVRATEQERGKSICFITGVPGAGKTLAGLDIAARRRANTGSEHAVFLSGNDPLVRVLREALTRDRVRGAHERGERLSKSAAERQTKSFIQNIRHFRDDTLKDPNPPDEHVVVFDEAQRAWRHEQLRSFMKRKRQTPDFPYSEPEFLLSAMDRHDWCCVVCLVGGGQEINVGEAGIGEWLHALQLRFPHWSVYCADSLTAPEYDWDGRTTKSLRAMKPLYREALHLSVSLRSFRAESLSRFVSDVVSGNWQGARALLVTIPLYPIFLTRDLPTARHWVRTQARGTERYGLLASSGGLRLRSEGINVGAKVEPELWFLNGSDDVRSSFFLEEAATEFEVQGLELDWSIVCWDANYRREEDRWRPYRFSGTRWQTVHNDDGQRYIANAYRVLLTRARQGCIVYVPRGDPSDPTRDPKWYDGVYEFLRICGIPEFPRGD